ncbi:13252_t:CDS:1, partial [Funneliformis geosporum]
KNNSKDLIDETFSILKILKEFVERKKVKYFAYELGCIYQQDDLKYINFENLKKLAGEIQPFVKMRKYSDLIVTIEDFDGTKVHSLS